MNENEFNEESAVQQQIIETKFNSPLPILLKIRDFIFGKKRPEFYTRLTVYISALIWFIFLLWHTISFFAISFRNLIFNYKKIDVEQLIFDRGAALGFYQQQFLSLLLNFQLISIAAWSSVFLGIVLIWRKKRSFSIFLFGGIAVYYLAMILFLGFRYFNEDITWFDKISVSILLLITGAYYFFLVLEKKENLEVEP